MPHATFHIMMVVHHPIFTTLSSQYHIMGVNAPAKLMYKSIPLEWEHIVHIAHELSRWIHFHDGKPMIVVELQGFHCESKG